MGLDEQKYLGPLTLPLTTTIPAPHASLVLSYSDVSSMIVQWEQFPTVNHQLYNLQICLGFMHEF